MFYGQRGRGKRIPVTNRRGHRSYVRGFKPEKVTVQHRETELIETHRKTYRHRQRQTDIVKTIRDDHTFMHLNRQKDPVTSHMDPRPWISNCV